MLGYLPVILVFCFLFLVVSPCISQTQSSIFSSFQTNEYKLEKIAVCVHYTIQNFVFRIYQLI